MKMRKLVTKRTITDLTPIEGADAIECATIDGWKVVVKKGEFSIGAPCVYFEIDSFLPETDSRYSFLMKSKREFEGVFGHRLRTIKLRGQVSQGLVLPVAAFPELTDQENMDEVLGIKKWEAPIPANLSGQVQGSFPSFIQKTDQERCQNLGFTIFGYEDQSFPIDVSTMPALIVSAKLERGELVHTEDGYHKIVKASASRDDLYEVTTKLDGSSCTIYYRDGEFGVCSRNQALKINAENEGNTFVRMFHENQFAELLPAIGRNIAVQGEVMGPNIQGNRENLKNHMLFIFDIYDIDKQEYMGAEERNDLIDFMRSRCSSIQRAPVLHQSATLEQLGLHTIDDLLRFAEGPSLFHAVREGVVFKRLDGKFSFKAISNTFLAKEKD